MAYLISSMEPQRGFHPTSTSTIRLPIPHPNPLTSNSNKNPYEACTLHLYFALPALVFVDTHELAQRIGQYGFAYWGGRDLEKPVHALPPPPSGDDKEAYSEVLVNLKLYDEEGEGWDLVDGETIRIEVPLHLRYGTPRSTRSRNGQGQEQEETGYEKIEVDWPTTFLLCPSSSSSMLRPPQTSSQPRLLPAHILAALPSSQKKHDQILIPIPPHPNYTHSAASALYLPVGDTSDLAFVEPLTALTILLCFFWLLRASCRTARRLNREGGDNWKEE